MTTTTAPGTRAALARHDVLLVLSIAATGIVASRVVNPALIFPTAIVGLGVLRLARRTAHAADVVADETHTRNLPPALDHVVAAVMAELTDGPARMLLGAIVQQADLLFARHESAFDDSQETATRRNVTELVTAACATARELSNLDSARTSVGASMGTPTPAQLELTGRLEKARTLMANRLNDAADALRGLYTAGVEHGTPASDRVAELAAELRGDAAARGQALAELGALLERLP
jgi:hypothetical protein